MSFQGGHASSRSWRDAHSMEASCSSWSFCDPPGPPLDGETLTWLASD